jgi:hypothetical protein
MSLTVPGAGCIVPSAVDEMFGVDFPSFITYDADHKSEKLKMMAAVLSRPAKPWPYDATFIRLMMSYEQAKFSARRSSARHSLIPSPC